jgi:hypothetical protein
MRFHFNAIDKFRSISIKSSRFNVNCLLLDFVWRSQVQSYVGGGGGMRVVKGKGPSQVTPSALLLLRDKSEGGEQLKVDEFLNKSQKVDLPYISSEILPST